MFWRSCGWERAIGFFRRAVKEGVTPEYKYSGEDKIGSIASEEHLAVRQKAGFFDMSSLAKFRLEGMPAVLQRVRRTM